MTRKYEILFLALSGAIFSGYLSGIKFFTSGCVLTVPCPSFLGQPACYFGFAMFVLLTLVALLWTMGFRVRKWVVGLSALGALFALYFSALEWGALMALFAHFSLLAVPSCPLGLVVYLAVFILALLERPAPHARI